MEVKQGAASVRARCRADGGPDVAWQPSRARGQSSGDAVSAAALTGPRAAAQTGTQFRPLVRKPVVAWTPPRRCLRGVSHGGAVDDGGVGPRPARPHDPAASALCRKRGYGSLGYRTGASHGGGHSDGGLRQAWRAVCRGCGRALCRRSRRGRAMSACHSRRARAHSAAPATDSICRASGSALLPFTTFSSPDLMGQRRRSAFSGRNLVACLLRSWHPSRYRQRLSAYRSEP